SFDVHCSFLRCVSAMNVGVSAAIGPAVATPKPFATLGISQSAPGLNHGSLSRLHERMPILMVDGGYLQQERLREVLMDVPNKEFALAGSLEDLKAKGRLVVHGGHRPILVIYDRGRVFALDNRCPHMGFPLERGSVEDGILTCHWHHARFDLESGCTFDLWADDVPICPVEVRNGDVWVKTAFGH